MLHPPPPPPPGFTHIYIGHSISGSCRLPPDRPGFTALCLTRNGRPTIVWRKGASVPLFPITTTKGPIPR